MTPEKTKKNLMVRANALSESRKRVGVDALPLEEYFDNAYLNYRIYRTMCSQAVIPKMRWLKMIIDVKPPVV